MPALRRRIESLRQAAGKRPLAILVGSAAFLGRLDLGTSLGADATAADAADAVRLAMILTEPARKLQPAGSR